MKILLPRENLIIVSVIGTYLPENYYRCEAKYTRTEPRAKAYKYNCPISTIGPRPSKVLTLPSYNFPSNLSYQLLIGVWISPKQMYYSDFIKCIQILVQVGNRKGYRFVTPLCHPHWIESYLVGIFKPYLLPLWLWIGSFCGAHV